jgi:hypothetical protein
MALKVALWVCKCLIWQQWAVIWAVDVKNGIATVA